MPRGWYLAQGLIPLGESSSDDEEGPCELPNGRVVCGPHGLVVCPRCFSDYSFMDDVISGSSDDEDTDAEDEDEDEDDFTNDNIPLAPPSVGLDLIRGTGQVFPTKFIPAAPLAPLELFSGRKAHMAVTRITLRNDTGTCLIRTDGACLNNGQRNPTAGCGFWHGLGPSGDQLTASFRLEKQGPFGDPHDQTSNRAELRAVIAALRFRYWPGEDFHTLVIATDSEYVVEGCTTWARTWIRNGWRTRLGPVKNKDMWEALLGEVERFDHNGMAVKFWRIPREANMVADAAAKSGAGNRDAPEEWGDIYGLVS
ncbi:hypothetical protein SPBR_07596 [Sporothrix brasiliensis 5110]|uniref:ribonuclease H n=1 Tax=Sporothrix brasiliensis 5110 TaxID=1398154 RepID=A0A0C2IWT4_9PEZI|nr:uncharacterized protein SPBR_07596 [Sporothrix brasiliensis 5110]KIH89492.1 hypothetical protein SPBR_07596 [Sporothrix brasiliensis 5110]